MMALVAVMARDCSSSAGPPTSPGYRLSVCDVLCGLGQVRTNELSSREDGSPD